MNTPPPPSTIPARDDSVSPHWGWKKADADKIRKWLCELIYTEIEKGNKKLKKELDQAVEQDGEDVEEDIDMEGEDEEEEEEGDEVGKRWTPG